MTDLRGFTSLSERLPPERVVGMLNRYLTTMVSVIKKYQGTIDEFIGDAIFVLFGAPVWQEDDAQRAVACAVAMQLAMDQINEQNRQEDLPEIEMGIGVHTGQVVVGNIGSPERMKYGVVGSQVNLTSRIQSFTTGGQILVSEVTRQEVGQILKVGRHREVMAKGIETPIGLYEVLGIRGNYKLSLPDAVEALTALASPVPFAYDLVEASETGGAPGKGRIVKLSAKGAEVQLDTPVPDLSNLKIHMTAKDGREIPGTLYAKVVGMNAGNGKDISVSIRFTSLPPEVDAFLRGFSAPQMSEAPSTPRREAAAKLAQPKSAPPKQLPN
jgi:adenylate cyclase